MADDREKNQGQPGGGQGGSQQAPGRNLQGDQSAGGQQGGQQGGHKPAASKAAKAVRRRAAASSPLAYKSGAVHTGLTMFFRKEIVVEHSCFATMFYRKT